jgi:hypothetical protein
MMPKSQGLPMAAAIGRMKPQMAMTLATVDKVTVRLLDRAASAKVGSYSLSVKCYGEEVTDARRTATVEPLTDG